MSENDVAAIIKRLAAIEARLAAIEAKQAAYPHHKWIPQPYYHPTPAWPGTVWCSDTSTSVLVQGSEA